MWGFMICSVIHYLKNLLLKGKKRTSRKTSLTLKIETINENIKTIEIKFSSNKIVSIVNIYACKYVSFQQRHSLLSVSTVQPISVYNNNFNYYCN